MNLLAFMTAHKVGSSALGGVIAGAMAAEAVAPIAVAATDYTGISALLIAIGSLFAVIGVLVVNVINARTARKAQEAKDAMAAEDRREVKAALASTAAAAEAAKSTAETTGRAVDGKMEEMKVLIERTAKAEGKAEEKDAQRDREAAVALAGKVAHPIATDANGTPAAEKKMVETGPTPDAVLAEAAGKAKSLLEAAAVVAANLVIKAKEEAKAVEQRGDAKAEAKAAEKS